MNGIQRKRVASVVGLSVIERISITRLHQVSEQQRKDDKAILLMAHQAKIKVQNQITDRALKLAELTRLDTVIEKYRACSAKLEMYIAGIDDILLSPGASVHGKPGSAPSKSSSLSSSPSKKTRHPKR